MGAGTSRRLSVSNPDPPGNIIKVSMVLIYFSWYTGLVFMRYLNIGIQVTEEVAKRLTSRQTPPAQQKPPEPTEIAPPPKPKGWFCFQILFANQSALIR